MAQAVAQVRTTRTASPERWQRAAERALAEGIEVRRVNASGMWVANSGTDANVAYLLEITGSLVQSRSCPAGTFGDPCWKHAAWFNLDAGLLAIDDPEGHPRSRPPSIATRAVAAVGSGIAAGARSPVRRVWCAAARRPRWRLGLPPSLRSLRSSSP